jgi:hypothetical protein
LLCKGLEYEVLFSSETLGDLRQVFGEHLLVLWVLKDLLLNDLEKIIAFFVQIAGDVHDQA